MEKGVLALEIGVFWCGLVQQVRVAGGPGVGLTGTRALWVASSLLGNNDTKLKRVSGSNTRGAGPTVQDAARCRGGAEQK